MEAAYYCSTVESLVQVHWKQSTTMCNTIILSSQKKGILNEKFCAVSLRRKSTKKNYRKNKSFA